MRTNRLKPIENETHYGQLAVLLDDLLDLTRGQLRHPLRDLLEVVTRLVQERDASQPLVLVEPQEMLAWYMSHDGLNQTTLLSQTGLDQSLISKHLLGKPEINLRYARLRKGLPSPARDSHALGLSARSLAGGSR